MRAYELMEDTNDLTRWWPEIEKECSDILALYHQHKRVFYRGANAKGWVVKAEPRTDRKPRDSGHAQHNLMQALMVAMGEETTRENSIAMINYDGIAGSYGMEHIIFPCNGFKFLYSNNTTDWIKIVSQTFEEFRSFMIEHRNTLNFTDITIRDRTFGELLRNGDKGELNIFVRNNLELVKTFYSKIETQFQFKRDDISGALTSGLGAEVMISGKPYYMVHGALVDHLNKKLGFKLSFEYYG